MPRRQRIDKTNVIPCKLSREVKERIADYADKMREAAPKIGSHGLSEEEFWRAGIFHGAIEKLRGKQAATMAVKKEFVWNALTRLKESGRISEFSFTGSRDRHDYTVVLPNGRQSVFEAKGSLDGNNTNIFKRPANADEFFIWSLSQNAGSDPKHNLWSGVHTRLGATIIAENTRVDALIVWDMLCGYPDRRPCPKVLEGRGLLSGALRIPPPCIYLFPRTVPDPRNNPKPDVWRISEVGLPSALLSEFGGDERDVTEVHIEARMNGTNVQRKTTLMRGETVVVESDWTDLKRASR